MLSLHEDEDVPFCTDHKDTREGQPKKRAAALGVEDCTGLESAPGAVGLVRGREPGGEDQEEEGEPVGDGQGNGAAEHAERGVVH